MSTGYNKPSDTGQGATIVFATSAFVGDYRSIGETKHVSTPVEDKVLSSTHESFIPGDTINMGETEAEVVFDRRSALPPLNIPQLITITLPTGPGDLAPATYIGSGFLTERSLPQFASNTLQTSKIKIKWDCKATIPAFTPATVAP